MTAISKMSENFMDLFVELFRLFKFSFSQTFCLKGIEFSDTFSLGQGSESPKNCLVLVPFFSASPKNVLVLVPYFSALALSTKALILVPISTKISALVRFSALPIFCQI